jgi:hypothetical protein
MPFVCAPDGETGFERREKRARMRPHYSRAAPLVEMPHPKLTLEFRDWFEWRRGPGSTWYRPMARAFSAVFHVAALGAKLFASGRFIG